MGIGHDTDEEPLLKLNKGVEVDEQGHEFELRVGLLAGEGCVGSSGEREDDMRKKDWEGGSRGSCEKAHLKNLQVMYVLPFTVNDFYDCLGLIIQGGVHDVAGRNQFIH